MHRHFPLLLIAALSAFFCHTTLAESYTGEDATRPAIVLIIDDLGYSRELGIRATELPGPINCAILPHTPNAISLANKASQLGHEILIHTPMSNISDKPLGPGGLTVNMGQEEFTQTLREAIEAVPFAKGVSNHMGSLLTQHQQHMEWLMEELSLRDYYFVDSRTTPNSLAYKAANQQNIPSLRRDIFLDHHRNADQIARQYKKLLAKARRDGIAVAIAHPYPETLQLLEQELPKLAAQGFKLMSITNAILAKNNTQTSHSENLALLQ